MIALEQFLTTDEAAKLSGLTVGYITRLLRGSKLQGRQIRRVWFVEKASLDRYMASNRKPGPKPK
jgi:excisionase family DNA binding protein